LNKAIKADEQQDVKEESAKSQKVAKGEDEKEKEELAKTQKAA